jgi:predicted aspartyl protease
MIIGSVTSDNEAVIRVTIRDAAGQHHDFEGVIDTGFTDWLTLPSSDIAQLNLQWR